MLVRSQNKEVLANMEGPIAIEILDNGKGHATMYWKDSYALGAYSSKEKAIKALDMIQEAYAGAELIPMAVPNIGKMFTEASVSKENELLAEAFGEALMNKMVFQMPADSEVEV